MTRFFLLAALAFCSIYTHAQQSGNRITIENQTNLKRNELVRVDWATILKFSPKIDTANFKVVNQETNAPIPCQLETIGRKEVKYLLLQVSVDAKASLKVQMSEGKSEPVQTKTYARYVPERKDDFAWENDKIAFRAYGKSLEGSNENAHGIDVWVKRTSAMVINKRYKLDNYHQDHGDGMDYYSVGETLGAGDMAPYLADSVWYLGNYRNYRVLDNGPLRTTFQLSYDEASANGQMIKVQRTISIDAGSQMNRIENSYTLKENSRLPVAVGLATRNELEKLFLKDRKGIIGYWEPVHGADGITGVGAILEKINKIIVKNNQLLAITTVKSNEPIVYYAGAAWNKAGEITTNQQWFDYLSDFRQKLKKPLIVNVR